MNKVSFLSPGLNEWIFVSYNNHCFFSTVSIQQDYINKPGLLYMYLKLATRRIQDMLYPLVGNVDLKVIQYEQYMSSKQVKLLELKCLTNKTIGMDQ